MKRRFDPLGLRREGKGTPAPKEGVAKYFYLLWNHAWKLIGVNLLFLAFSLPVVTMPAALCAMNRVLIKLVRDSNVYFWEEFRDEFKSDFLRSLPLGLLFGGLLFLGYFLMSFGLANYTNLIGMLAFALGILTIVFSLGRAIYAFLMRAMFSLKTRDLLKNANIMAATRGGRGLLAVAVELIAFALVAMFFPYSLLVVLLCGFSLTQYTLCFILNDPIQDRIISPWEEMQEMEDPSDA